MKIKSILFLAFTFVLISLMALTANAAEADYESTTFTVDGFQSSDSIHDGLRDTYSSALGEGSVTVSRTDGISSIYVIHDTLPTEWYITDPSSGRTVPCAENGFLHEYIDVSKLFGNTPEMLVLTFPDSASVCDIYAFSEGELPDFVQVWEKPLESADLLLISSHSDDEQLFFAGILPYYAGERDLDVQVMYMVQHYELYGEINHQRPHEQLDGLWAVGIKNYPIISDFPDLYAESKDRQTALDEAKAVFESAGVTYDDFVKYITDNLRRFKPLVVVSHDFDGEYGHGTHVMCASALADAVKLAADSSHDPESAAKYGGAWCVEKLYIHLYEENKITLDLDIPLKAFDGKTAFEMTQYGFSFHKSQHWTWFNEWINGTADEPITKASQIKDYSPCEYGLFFTKVGADVEGGDFFENVVPYAVREASLDEPGALNSIEAPATLPSETTETVADITGSASVETEDDQGDGKRSNRVIITAVVIISVMICVVLGIFIVFNSKMSAKNRRRRRNRAQRK